MPDFMVQGQLDDFEKAIESEDVDWIVDQHTDDIVRKMPDGVTVVGKVEFRDYWEDFFKSVDNIDVESIDFVTSGFPPDKLALHWRFKATIVAPSKYFKWNNESTIGSTVEFEGMDFNHGSGLKTAKNIAFWNSLEILNQTGYKVTR
jgi:hypothetical protein